MEKYQNKGGTSSVKSFDIGFDYIIIRFKDSYKSYTYSYLGAGMYHVEKMKVLARSGIGLGSYIKTHVSSKYDR